MPSAVFWSRVEGERRDKGAPAGQAPPGPRREECRAGRWTAESAPPVWFLWLGGSKSQLEGPGRAEDRGRGDMATMVLATFPWSQREVQK